jgi:hypothetical protein
MIQAVLAQVTGQLENRFLLNAFFPTLVASLLAAAVVSTGYGGVDAVIDSWEEQSAAVQALSAIAWIAAVLVVANVVASSILFIIGVFEGYHLPAPIREAGQAQWFHKWGQVTDADVKQRRYPVHPARLTWKDLAPTRLGNVLRSAETYPEARYGVQATRTWPRLYLLLPEEVRTALAEARASMEFMLVIAFYATCLAPTSAIYLLVVQADLGWTFAALLGGTAVAFAAYFGALTPAAVYGNQVRAAYDNHRFKLLEALHAPLPASVDEERLVWAHVTRYLELGEAHPGRYVRAR